MTDIFLEQGSGGIVSFGLVKDRLFTRIAEPEVKREATHLIEVLLQVSSKDFKRAR